MVLGVICGIKLMLASYKENALMVVLSIALALEVIILKLTLLKDSVFPQIPTGRNRILLL